MPDARLFTIPHINIHQICFCTYRMLTSKSHCRQFFAYINFSFLYPYGRDTNRFPKLRNHLEVVTDASPVISMQCVGTSSVMAMLGICAVSHHHTCVTSLCARAFVCVRACVRNIYVYNIYTYTHSLTHSLTHTHPPPTHTHTQ